MSKRAKGDGMKKGTRLDDTIATVVTMALLVLSLPFAFLAFIYLVLDWNPVGAVFLLPILAVVVTLYCLWLLLRSGSERLRMFYVSIGIVFGATLVVVIPISREPCSGFQCMELRGVYVWGIGLIAAFLVSLYYLVRIRLDGSRPKKAKIK